MSNPGVQSGWPTFTDGPTGVSPGADDCNRWSAGIKTLSGRPKGRWLRYDTNLVVDGQFHDCRVIGSVYDFDYQGGFLCPGAQSQPTIPQTDFTINTTGVYALGIRERFAGPVNGNHELRCAVPASGAVLMHNAVAIVPLHILTNYCYTETLLTAGTVIRFQHMYTNYGDPNKSDLTLYVDSPTPEITISMIGEVTTHS